MCSVTVESRSLLVKSDLMKPVEPELVSPNLPEMHAIFGDQPVQGQTSHSGG